MSEGTPPLRVLCSFREPRPTTNPYIVMLLRQLRATDGLHVATFSFRSALLQRWDVFHSHWPEVALAAGSWPSRVVRRLLFALMLVAFAIRRTAVVQTVHNLRPHEDHDVLARWLLRRLSTMTTTRIALNRQTEVDSDDEYIDIPHGHYVDWFAEQPTNDAEPGTVVFAGLIRPYKNVDGLVRAFRAIDDTEIRLVVLGRCEDAELAARLRREATEDPRITADLRFYSDAELSAALTRASVVALPYQDLHNSGAALLALSLGRPILVPDNEVTAALAAEVGDDWVRRFDGPVTADHVAEAAWRPLPIGQPDLERRSWHAVGRAHREVYRAAVSLRGNREP